VKVIIVSAPSGAGKTTLVKHALHQPYLNLAFSVSACTRAPRPHELHGRDYYFLSVEEFKEKISNQQFLEYEEVYPDNYYGTLKAEVARLFSLGKNVIFDVDVIGGLNIKKHFGKQALALFVSPPDLPTLEQRLKNRQSDSEAKIKMRLQKAEYEMGFATQFDKILINDNLQVALKEIEKLISSFLETN